MPDQQVHPLETYTRSFNSSCSQLVAERTRQDRIANTDATDDDERSEASDAVIDLTDRLSFLDDANADFLVSVYGKAIPPSLAVVDETVAMDDALAKLVVSAGRAVAMLQIADAFLAGAIDVYKGGAAAPPAAG
jgi:hypothetical protein